MELDGQGTPQLPIQRDRSARACSRRRGDRSKRPERIEHAVQPVLISGTMVVARSRIRLVKGTLNCFGSRSLTELVGKEKTAMMVMPKAQRVIGRCGRGFLTTAEREHRRAATEGDYLPA